MGVKVFNTMEDGLAGCDVVIMLRLQNERMKGARLPSAQEYFKFYGLTQEKLALARPDAIVMHPGPMNRGVEITSEVADALVRALDPLGALVLIQAEHLCMSMRGVKKPGSQTVTSAVRGIFESSAATRAEAMSLITQRGSR